MTERERLKARLAELDERIAAVEQWGALLTALDEERRAVLAALNEPDTLG